MKLNHLYESQQFSPELLFSLFQNAEHMKQNPKFYSSALNEKVLATLFYEPSTRTRLSFESAMLKLGGSVISTENAKEFSSAVKGESIQDTIRIVSSYADAIVIRHYEQGAAELASQISKVPIINAGDGKGQHPTQALLDMFTIYKEINRIKDFTIIFVGDLASGRTVREDIKAYLIRHNIEFKEETDLNKVLPIADIIYMTRIQKERISKEDYEEAKGKYIINENNLHLIKQDARIMHPLPHVEEISLPLHIEQEDKRVAYFRQAENGLYIRMALLHHLLK